MLQLMKNNPNNVTIFTSVNKAVVIKINKNTGQIRIINKNPIPQFQSPMSIIVIFT